MNQYSEKELIEDLQRVSKEHCNGEVPKIKDVKKYGKTSLVPYNRMFGGIIEAREKANFEKVDLRKKKTTFNYNFQYKMLPSTKKEILNRNNKSCRICSENSNIEIHHITPVRYWNVEEEHEKMNNPRNLISLCRSCHVKLEGKFKGRNHKEFEKLAKDYLGIEEVKERNGIFDY